MAKYFRSEAGHHRECAGPYPDCNCSELYKRDEQLHVNEDLEEAYRMMYDPDWGNDEWKRFLMYDGPSKNEIKEIEKSIRAQIAHEIRAELVCCDEYDRVQAAKLEAKHENRPFNYTDLRDYHAICHWGEASARIAEDRDY